MKLVKSGPHGTPDLRDVLAERYAAAVRRNRRFSLRAFARQLGIDHSTLSQVLRGKRRLSPRLVDTIGRRLGLPAEVIRFHRQSAQRGGAAPEPPPRGLDLDTFQLLFSWPHRAILELLRLKAFRADSRWIAHALGLPVAEVNIALQRLLRLRRLEMVSPERWLDHSQGEGTSAVTALPEQASAALARETYELAEEALQRIPDSGRIHAQAILAVPRRSLPEMAALAERFVADVHALVGAAADCDDVYLLEVSAFPVTRLQTHKEKSAWRTRSPTGKS